jgi:hypothetical protein
MLLKLLRFKKKSSEPDLKSLEIRVAQVEKELVQVRQLFNAIDRKQRVIMGENNE